MSLKNLNANKIPKILKKKLSNKKIIRLYNAFEKDFNIKKNYAVAVSGGPDSMALAFLTKIYSLKNKVNCRYFIINHKLRKESTKEAHQVKKILNNFDIKSEILTWHGRKPIKNIQSSARKKRYELLFSKCKQLRINYLVIGHHSDDLLENFFIRMIRGSGLKGLVSLDKKITLNKINLIRPLLNFDKKDLQLISSHVFNFFIKDPSNEDIKYKRIKIRKLIEEFKDIGLDKVKLFLTLNNLKKSNFNKTQVGIRPEFVNFSNEGIAVKVKRVSDTGRHKVIDTESSSGSIKILASSSTQIPSGSAHITFDQKYTYAYGDNWIIE